jgi:hypothetical protein
MKWIERYAEMATNTQSGELSCVMVQNFGRGVALFSGADPSVVARVDRHTIRRLFGRSSLVKVLCALERAASGFAWSAGIPAMPVKLHANLYGPEEMAHTPDNVFAAPYLSLNLAHDQVRRIVLGVMTYNAAALCAAADLTLHEVAHAALVQSAARAGRGRTGASGAG